MQIFSLLLSSILTLPLAAGALSTACIGRFRTRRGLLFHDILDQPRTLSQVHTTAFHSFIEYLKNSNIQTSCLSQYIEQNSDSSHLITFDDALQSVYTKALPILRQNNCKATIFAVAGYLGKMTSWDIVPSSLHMSSEQLKEMSDAGFEIGSHSLTHANLPFLSDSALKKELQDSKALLEDLLGKEVTSFSFPFGSWSVRVWERALDVGYTCGTVYRNFSGLPKKLIPVLGAYRIDNCHSLVQKAFEKKHISASIAAAKILSHFAKGTPLWLYRKEYSIKA